MATTAKIAKDIKMPSRNGSQSAGKKITEAALPASQPLLALRPPARLSAQVRLCRLCFRQLALNGEIPGVIKASW